MVGMHGNPCLFAGAYVGGTVTVVSAEKANGRQNSWRGPGKSSRRVEPGCSPFLFSWKEKNFRILNFGASLCLLSLF